MDDESITSIEESLTSGLEQRVGWRRKQLSIDRVKQEKAWSRGKRHR